MSLEKTYRDDERILYCCFSKNQKRFLVECGNRCLLKTIHKDSMLPMYIFLITEELSESLTEYSKESERRRLERESM